MPKPTRQGRPTHWQPNWWLAAAVIAKGLLLCGGDACHAQQARVDTSIDSKGLGKIILEAHGELTSPPVFYTATAESTVLVGAARIEQAIGLAVDIIQGDAQRLSFGLNGPGEVTNVQAKHLQSWSVRREGSRRFLDLHLNPGISELNVEIKIRSAPLKLPAAIQLAHLAPGDSVGFHSMVKIEPLAGVDVLLTEVNGFVPVGVEPLVRRFQTTTGGRLELAVRLGDAAAGPVELMDATLTGDVDSGGESMSFQFRSTAIVTAANSEVTILQGNVAVSQIPDSPHYRLRLVSKDGRGVYQLVFAKPGTFPVAIDFVAALSSPRGNGHELDFTVAASGVVPLRLTGLGDDLVFRRDQESVVPVRDKDDWLGFLPASGRVLLRLSPSRETTEGKLFFSTTAHIEARIGAGLLRQDHHIDYQVLQGELPSISMQLHGPGEILDVQGRHLVAWKISDEGESRQLDITLSQPITATSQIKVRSQTPLGAFPVRVAGLRLNPLGAIRHSGYLRLANSGSVRLEPLGLTGLSQLAPEQFPGESIKARQVFAYRFPAADHHFEVAADRIQPEVNVSELVVYQLAEADRVIEADIELDIREAPIREWDLRIPADYSVVSVTGANVADTIAATDVVAGMRNLSVIFGEDVAGRQLVRLYLEKNEVATAGNWKLPRLEYPAAKTVRGNVGIVGAPGFRLVVEETDLLVEKPLSYFPKSTVNLQHAFRIRERLWSATLQIELLDQSVLSDVFHLYSLSDGTIYGSALLNYFVTGAPVSEWKIQVPEGLVNVLVDGQDVRTWRREGDTLIVSLHQPVMGPYTLLVTFEQKTGGNAGSFVAGQVAPIDVQGERGYIQIVSPMQVQIEPQSLSDDLLPLDPLELPAEFRLLTAAPSLGTWQYTERPFTLDLKVNWFQPGTTVMQVVEFSEATSHVSQEGELVTDVLYYVKSRGERTLKIELPAAPARLWEVAVGGRPVTATQAGSATLVPLPGGTDPNVPVDVRLRFGKPTVKAARPVLALPTVFAPVLKTEWHIRGDAKRVLVPRGGSVEPPQPVLRPAGFDWVAKRGTSRLFLIGLLTAIGVLASGRSTSAGVLGLIALAIGLFVAWATALLAFSQTGSPTPLDLSLPILTAGETIELHVQNMPLWRSNLSWFGVLAILTGTLVMLRSWLIEEASQQRILRVGGMLLIALGILFQRDGAPWFFALLGLAMLMLLLLPRAWILFAGIEQRRRKLREAAAGSPEHQQSGTAPGPATVSILLGTLAWMSIAAPAQAATPSGLAAADSIRQQWQLQRKENRLRAAATFTVSGRPGDQFVLLRAPAVLTNFAGQGLRLTKRDLPGQGLTYMVSIPLTDEPSAVESATQSGAIEKTTSAEALTVESLSDETDLDAVQIADQPQVAAAAVAVYEATFDFQLEALEWSAGVPVLTGSAAVQEIDLSFDAPDWEVASPTAIRVESIAAAPGKTRVKVLLGPGKSRLLLYPKARDITQEETQFFIEGSSLYLPGPGVVDGRHRLHVRTSQGRVRELNVLVPLGFTVSDVSGPVGDWQFDVESGHLKLQIEPTSAESSIGETNAAASHGETDAQLIDVVIETQRSLSRLPLEVDLAPLRVMDASGEVGLVAIAFGPEAKPEKTEPEAMSAVNVGDFDASLLTNKQAVLHRVFRYGAEGGKLSLRVVPVDSEVRVSTKQVVSLGDERVVVGINFTADISRAGLFQLSFPLPSGFEVESLTGAALHHWAELRADDQRHIILHLNGKTLGRHSFALALTGAAPTDQTQWSIPHFKLREATRQTGELVVKPTTGIRLRTVARKNVSETDPRTMGGKAQGALAFRLLQRDWNLVLGVERLEPWVTGQVLHEVTLREGQTRSALWANFDVENASIRALRVTLPIANQDAIRTVRASGKAVSDIVRIAPNSNLWEIHFKRRMIGKIELRIEYERRGDRAIAKEVLRPAEFPQARQLTYFFGVRAGGRLEIAYNGLPTGWRRADWSTVPQLIRAAGPRTTPELTLRVVAPAEPLEIRAQRHSLADALKLRVAQGTFTTVLSPTGDQLTAVDVTMEVIQRSSLSVSFPAGGQLYSIFVNGESVHSIRNGDGENAWQFTILPGADDRIAKVEFVYSVPGGQIRQLKLQSPKLNVPLENIDWNVIAPQGFELTDNGGTLELKSQTRQEKYDRDSYLSRTSGKRRFQAQQAAQLLEQANQLLQAGQQIRARRALNSVANRYALDAASNEDARVQLENLQTQQAVVGLNTRRQRLYLDHERDGAQLDDNTQLRKAAVGNRVLQQGKLDFQPQQLSQLLQGNTTEDNAVLQQIAGRLVHHQRNTEPAAQAITITLPEEGTVYTFGRSVQVTENTPLELDLGFALQGRVGFWQTTCVVVLLIAVCGSLSIAPRG